MPKSQQWGKSHGKNATQASTKVYGYPQRWTVKMTAFLLRSWLIFLSFWLVELMIYTDCCYRSWNLTSSRSNGSLSMTSHDHEPVSMMPCNHEQSLLNEVKAKQSHFFNSLFPSRANRFGFPVYPERTFGIPSQMNAPVSFAGFSPGTSINNN